MKTLRVLSIFGTRPEAVKMAPLVRELKKREEFESFVCVTAQHRQMLDQILDLFGIVPDIDLNLMQPDQSLAEIAAAIFTQLDPVIADLNPDWILVQGDTTTVMAAALLAYYHHIRVGHVEAGLRTGDKWQPFPEEINRRVAGVVADLHFAPTDWARSNLLREGVAQERIRVTGNPIIDALNWVLSIPPTQQVLSLFEQIGIPEPPGEGTPAVRLILLTAHRRENFGKPLENICAAALRLVNHYHGQIKIVYPVHLNPNVQETAYRLLAAHPDIILTPPLDYLPLVNLMRRATLVLTDSGGIQEEAPSLGVPVLVLREVTERPEGIRAGTARLVGTNADKIVAEAMHLLDDPQAHAAMAHSTNPYGDGKAAERIVQAILDFQYGS